MFNVHSSKFQIGFWSYMLFCIFCSLDPYSDILFISKNFFSTFHVFSLSHIHYIFFSFIEFTSINPWLTSSLSFPNFYLWVSQFNIVQFATLNSFTQLTFLHILSKHSRLDLTHCVSLSTLRPWLFLEEDKGQYR